MITRATDQVPPLSSREPSKREAWGTLKRTFPLVSVPGQPSLLLPTNAGRLVAPYCAHSDKLERFVSDNIFYLFNFILRPDWTGSGFLRLLHDLPVDNAINLFLIHQ
jgi:hypothetical protein